MPESKVVPIEELDWLRTRADDALLHEDETVRERMKRKIIENPLVPIGGAATLGALVYGLYSFTQGKRHQSQYAMRARVVFQTFTLCALSYAMYKMGEKSVIAIMKERFGTPAAEIKAEVSTPQK